MSADTDSPTHTQLNHQRLVSTSWPYQYYCQNRSALLPTKHFITITFSSSPLASPIIRGRSNGYEYHSSTMSCPVHPPTLTTHFPHLFDTSLSTWFSLFLSVSFLVLAHLTFFLALNSFVGVLVKLLLYLLEQFFCKANLITETAHIFWEKSKNKIHKLVKALFLVFH